MISRTLSGHDRGDDDVVTSVAAAARPPRDARLKEAVSEHTAFLWRTARRFGVRDRDVEDALQRAWLVFAEKLDDVRLGAERAYLVGVLARVASHARRSYQRRPEDLGVELDPLVACGAPTAEDVADRRRARALLDDILDAMEDESRQVFVLFELEELDSGTIAELLDIPQGTVKSRLRRARELYEAHVARFRARNERTGGVR